MIETDDVELRINPRPLLLGGGVASLLIGIVLLVWPAATVSVLAILLGINFLLLGMVILSTSLVIGSSVGMKILGVFVGVLSMLAGVAVLGRPLQTVAVIVVVVGAFWVVGGILEVVGGILGAGMQPRWLSFLSGALSIVSGVLVLSWPGPTVAVLVWLIGLWSIVAGGVRIMVGLRLPKTAA